MITPSLDPFDPSISRVLMVNHQCLHTSESAPVYRRVDPDLSHMRCHSPITHDPRILREVPALPPIFAGLGDIGHGDSAVRPISH